MTFPSACLLASDLHFSGFSRTTPTVVLKPEQIRIVKQVICLNTGHPVDMADGAGLISPSLAKKIISYLGLTDVPAAFQARIGSAKGLWIVDISQDFDLEDDWIKIYPSQLKWVCDFEDPLHRTFEVREYVREASSAALNAQFIPVLESQAMSRQAMRQIIGKHLQKVLTAELVLDQNAWDDPVQLRAWMQQFGTPNRERLADDGVTFIGGLPKRSEDVITMMLDCGFEPKNSIYLSGLLKDQLKKKAQLLSEKMKIVVPQSTYLFMIPDFWGVLEPGEISTTFSESFVTNGFAETLLEDREVLVARAPAHFPSDIRKVKAVSKFPLRKLKNVVIFSTQGERPLADLLSGGDYDGDMAWICWDKDIVGNFQNADLPNAVDLQLKRCTLTLKDILRQPFKRQLQEGNTSLDKACIEFLQLGLSFALRPPMLGTCTKYKERLSYSLQSIKTESIIKLSWLLSALVDQAKQGTLFDEAAWKAFRLTLGTAAPASKPVYETDHDSRSPHQREQPHILDWLKFDVADPLIKSAEADVDKRISSSEEQDWDLTRIAREWETRSHTCAETRKMLTTCKHDLEILGLRWAPMHWKSGDDYTSQVNDLYHQWLAIRPDISIDKFPQLSAGSWSTGGSEGLLTEWTLLKAALTLKHFRGRLTLAWRMAGYQLAWMKAINASPGRPIPIVNSQYAFMKINSRLVARRAGLHGYGAGGLICS